MRDAAAAGHQVHAARPRDGFISEAVVMHDLALDEPRHRLNADVRVRRDVHRLLVGERDRAVAVEEAPPPDQPPAAHRQRPPDGEVAERHFAAAMFLQHDGSIMRVMSTWPALPLEDWIDTKNTLHRWTQVVGKIRLALTPLVNHWWNVPLYVTARGLTTSEIPYGDRWFDMEFDFISHVLRIRTSDGAEHDIPLGPRSVADLHREIFAVLDTLHIECVIWPMPVEIPDETIPLDRDEQHRAYDH